MRDWILKNARPKFLLFRSTEGTKNNQIQTPNNGKDNNLPLLNKKNPAVILANLKQNVEINNDSLISSILIIEKEETLKVK